MTDPPRFRQIPACHPAQSFVWRPSPAEPFRPYSCAGWFRPLHTSWVGKDLIAAANYADKANEAAGFFAPASPTFADMFHTWLRRFVRCAEPPQPEAPAPLRRRAILPPPSFTPLHRPSPEALQSLLHHHQLRNAPPHPDVIEHGWIADHVLTPAGHYALARGLIEAPEYFLSLVFEEISFDRSKYGSILRVAITALEDRHPPAILLLHP